MTDQVEYLTNLRKPIGYVEEREVALVTAQISAEFNEITGSPDLPRAAGYMLIVKLYVREEKTGSIIIPQSSLDEDKYQSVTGLVISVGPQAYQGKNVDGSERFPLGPWCRVGDFIVVPRYESFLMTWKGKIALAALPDDKVIAVVRDPTDVMAPHMAALI